MKKLIVSVSIIFVFYSTIFGQQIIEKRFYEDINGGYWSIENSKSKFYEFAIRQTDGTTRYEMRSKKDKKLIRLKIYKDSIQVGKWISIDGNEINYDFEVVHKPTLNDSILHYYYSDKSLKERISGNFEPPLFPLESNNFIKFMEKNLDYPEFAAEKGIQGRVISQFIVDETGQLRNISILNSVNKMLDKEVFKVLLLSPMWNPSRLDGKPIKVCVIVYTTFTLK